MGRSAILVAFATIDARRYGSPSAWKRSSRMFAVFKLLFCIHKQFRGSLPYATSRRSRTTDEGGLHEKSDRIGVRVIRRRHGVAGAVALPILQRRDGGGDRGGDGPGGRYAHGPRAIRGVGGVLAAAEPGGEPGSRADERHP